MATATDASCREGTCPCSQPEQPPDDFVCYQRRLSIEEDEAMRYRPFESDEGLTGAYEARYQ